MSETPTSPEPPAPGARRSHRIVLALLGSVALFAASGLILRNTLGIGAASPAVVWETLNTPPRAARDPLIPCDLDGDGRGDLVETSAPIPRVWFGRGDGTFDTVPFPFSSPPGIPLVLADLDGDRRSDFLLAANPRRLTLLSGWAFVWPMGGTPLDPSAPRALPANNLAPDAGAHVLLRQEGVFRSVRFADGQGLPDPRDGALLLPGDFDGDHHTDLIVRMAHDLGPPSEPAAQALGGDLPWPRFYDPERGYFATPEQAAAAPLAAPENPSFAELRYGVGTDHPRTLAAAHSSALHGMVTELTAADLNGDGRMDFVRQPKGELAAGDVALIYLSVPGGFSVDHLRPRPSSRRIDTALGGDDVELTAADLDGDGKMDLLWRRKRGGSPDLARLEAWLSIGDGTFYVVEPAGVDPAWLAPTTRLYPTDLDGDGRADLVIEDTRDPAAPVIVARQVLKATPSNN